MTISYHMQFDTIDDHFVPYAESYEDSTFILILHHSENHFRTITISYHCHFVP